jgi:hypothetical protein
MFSYVVPRSFNIPNLQSIFISLTLPREVKLFLVHFRHDIARSEQILIGEPVPKGTYFQARSTISENNKRIPVAHCQTVEPRLN